MKAVIAAVVAASVRISVCPMAGRENLLVENFLKRYLDDPLCKLSLKGQSAKNNFSMDQKMDIISLLQYTLSKVVETFSHNWFLLVLSILISAALKLYIDQDAIARFLRRNTGNSVLMSTGVAVTTPLCSCGTTAIVLGMMASTVPWAPIVAFLVASPLTSPQELFYSAGLFGWDFAIAFFVASILLGLTGGVIASFAESRGWLVNQAHMAATKPASVSPGFMNSSALIGLPVFEQPIVQSARPVVTLRTLIEEMLKVSKRLLPLFVGFTFVGYMLNGLIPTAWITSLFGAGHAYSIPLAATFGLPFYINTEASLPLVRALSQGAALAFLITGAAPLWVR